MPNLLVCLDGTWQDRDGRKRTNVARFAERAEGKPDQIVHYDPGVGTGNFDRVLGGVFGRGLAENVLEAYRFLALHWSPGTCIYIVGFSRGAWTARSLAGMIGNVGLSPPSRAAIRARWDAYRAGKLWQLGPAAHRSVPIQFLGVFDTVGRLGVPGGPISRRRTAFHDQSLGDHVKQACHAVALHERRRAFAPTLWRSPRAEQVWFRGAHDGVGSGAPALHYMTKRAAEAGLHIDVAAEPPLPETPADVPAITGPGMIGLLTGTRRRRPPRGARVAARACIEAGLVAEDRDPVDLELSERVTLQELTVVPL